MSAASHYPKGVHQMSIFGANYGKEKEYKAMAKYERLEMLGSGSYGEVWKVRATTICASEVLSFFLSLSLSFSL